MHALKYLDYVYMLLITWGIVVNDKFYIKQSQWAHGIAVNYELSVVVAAKKGTTPSLLF